MLSFKHQAKYEVNFKVKSYTVIATVNYVDDGNMHVSDNIKRGCTTWFPNEQTA